LLVIYLFYACQLHGRCTVLIFVPFKLGGGEEEEEVVAAVVVSSSYSSSSSSSSDCFTVYFCQLLPHLYLVLLHVLDCSTMIRCVLRLLTALPVQC